MSAVRTNRLRRFAALQVSLGLASALVYAACADSSKVNLLQVDATGVLYGLAYLDANGNGSLDPTDEPLPDLNVALTATRGGTTVGSAKTDSAGIFLMTEIPVGTYRLGLDPLGMGDSLEVVGGGTDVTVRLADTARVDLGVSFPVLSFEEIRDASVGRRVFTSGIALNPRPNFSDGVVHLQADSAWLRMLNVARGNINTGDSLRALGRTRRDNGSIVLDEVTTYNLVNLATIPQPVQRSTGVAAEAEGGRLDAALLRVKAAEILDTATVGSDFTFHVDDGSGPLLVVLRSFLQLNTAPFRPDTVIRIKEATGLLTPHADETGHVTWRLLPRGAADLTLEVKQADLSIEIEPDTTVTPGDTVTFRVVVSNAGPNTATQVEVADTVPVGLTFLSASATHGTYTEATRLWALDSLASGGQDTLRMKTVVTSNQGVLTQNRVWVAAPLKQVDPKLSNNVAGASVLIVIPPPGAASRH